MVGYVWCKAWQVQPTIGLLGDVMLGRGVAERLAEVPPEEVWSEELRELCLGCDLVVCNLECCISERGEPTSRVPGKPFFFRAPRAAVDSLRAIGAAAVGLANNHALDFEVPALLDTLDLLDEAGVKVAGAGPDRDTARRGAVVEGGATRIGLLAVSDHPSEFAAGDETPGIASADLARGVPDWLAAEVGRLRDECDQVIAFPHWGPNMNPDTARWQRRAAAAMVDAGATLVAGHSAHVFQGVGWDGDRPLLFDLGDALDDYAVDRRLRNDLGILALWRPGSAQTPLELIGLRLHHCRTDLAYGGDADWIATRLTEACPALGSAVERISEQRFRVSPQSVSDAR
jgi:poly-gamma-glutamate capsule biosynthesis protein CapA/YwtB (metallophosphatase superfamily)